MYLGAVNRGWPQGLQSGSAGAATPEPRHAFDVTARRVDEIPDPRLRDLALYWFSRCARDVVPRRADIDPLDFKPLLANVMLLDRIVQRERERFRFRLVGTNVVSIAGRELTGAFIDESLPGSYGEYVATLNRLALQRRCPVYSSSLYHDEGNFVNGLTYRLILPLRSGEGEPDLIFACQFWQRRQDQGHWSGDWRSVEPEIAVISSA